MTILAKAAMRVSYFARRYQDVWSADARLIDAFLPTQQCKKSATPFGLISRQCEAVLSPAAQTSDQRNFLGLGLILRRSR